MERPKYLITGLIIALVLLSGKQNALAQSPYKKTVYTAYINGEMNKWAAVIQTIERNNDIKTVDQKLELISYYYGYIGYLIGTKKTDDAQKLIVKGEKLIEQVLHTEPRNATAYAFKGSFIGFRIGISKFKAISLGPESAANVNKAVELDPTNTQAIVDKANALFYTPALFGGNKQEALKLFLKAAKLIESKKNTENNWFYLSLLTTIAKAYEKLDHTNQAKLTYEKILRVEPGFKWVKDDLYPNFIARTKS
jgi:tetratricopeptide (TPR) repeat protein